MATIHDIARVSGYDSATVSRALGGKSGVRQQTRDIILRIAKEMDYAPNYTAKQLKTKKSYNVAVIVNIADGQTLNNYFFNNILNSFVVVMEKHGYNVTFISKSVAERNNIVNYCRSRMFDGLFAVNADFQAGGIADLVDNGLPVIVAESVTAIPTNCLVTGITSNNRQAMYQLVQYVIAKGHTKLLYIVGDDSYVTDQRIAGFRQALADNNIAFDDDMLVQAHYSVLPSVNSAIEKVLQREQLPTAIFTPDDYSALPIYEAVRSKGLCIPEDISIIGFDGIELGQNMHPRLTTMKQDDKKIGTLAGNMLLELMENKQQSKHQCIIVPATLLVGDSVKQLK